MHQYTRPLLLAAAVFCSVACTTVFEPARTFAYRGSLTPHGGHVSTGTYHPANTHSRFEMPAEGDPWVARYGPDGSLQWSVFFDKGRGFDSGLTLVDGKTVVAGTLSYGVRIAIFSPTGCLLSHIALDLGNQGWMTQLARDPSGDFFVTTTLPSGFVLLRMSANGTVRWARNISTPNPLGSAAAPVPFGHGGVMLIGTQSRNAPSGASLLAFDASGELLGQVFVPLKGFNSAVGIGLRDGDGLLALQWHPTRETEFALLRISPTLDIRWQRNLVAHKPPERHTLDTSLRAFLVEKGDGKLAVASSIHAGEDGTDLALLELSPTGDMLSQQALDAGTYPILHDVQTTGTCVAVLGHQPGKDLVTWTFPAVGTWDPQLAWQPMDLRVERTTIPVAPRAVRLIPLTP